MNFYLKLKKVILSYYLFETNKKTLSVIMVYQTNEIMKLYYSHRIKLIKTKI